MNKWGALFNMGKAPAFQFYANDFMDATRFWEANACGLFIRCLCIQWTQGGLPADLRSLSKGVGMDFEEFERAWKVVASKFPAGSDGILRNSRLEKVRTRQNEISSERSNAGRAGVLAKANAKANASTKAKQRKVKEKEKEEGEDGGEGTAAHEPEIIPAGMSVELFHAIKRWEQYRREKRNALTPSGRVAFLAKCKSWGDARAIAAIDHSIAQGWTGCFEPQTNTNGKSTGPQSREERQRMVLEAVAQHQRDKHSGG